MKTLDSLSPFLRGYVEAALFTTDPDGPGGCDYAECGRADDMFPRVPESFLEQAQRDCEAFRLAHAELLEQAGDDAQNGQDFWYSRNGHGVGFFDRGYSDEIADPLQDAAGKCGEAYLDLGGWWLQEYSCQCGEQWTRPEDADNDPEYGSDTCDACGATVESLNRRRGEHLTAISAPEDVCTA